MLKLATLFSGIGSIEQSLKRLKIKHEIVFACDNGEIELDINVNEIKKQVSKAKTKLDKKIIVDNLYNSLTRKRNYVKESYLANYKINPNDFHCDIRFLDGRDYENKVDLLVGGSPCQSFSSIGKKGGLDDARGTLFYEYARLIKEIKPKVFIYENVKGLTTHDDGNTWKIIKNIFVNTLNYHITEPQILNACDYGIPQTRRRLFVIGIRKDIICDKFTYPKPIKLDYKMKDFLLDNCAEGCFISDKNGKIKIVKKKGHYEKKFILTPKVRDYVIKSGTKNFRTSTETDKDIARTLLKTMTQHHRAGVDNYITIGKEKNGKKILRSLTDREALRLMGYPDDFKMVVSSQQIFRQAGNSIVVDVMIAILKQIIKTNAFKGGKL